MLHIMGSYRESSTKMVWLAATMHLERNGSSRLASLSKVDKKSPSTFCRLRQFVEFDFDANVAGT